MNGAQMTLPEALLFIRANYDWLVLAIWSVLFLGIGAVVMWLYCHYRWFVGINVQIERERIRKLFRQGRG